MDEAVFQAGSDGRRPFALAVIIMLLCGCVDTVASGGGNVICEGACDAFSEVTLLICEERALANAEPDCADLSARDIGIDPSIAEVPVRFYVVVEGISTISGAQLALRFYDTDETPVRSIAIDDTSDGAKVVEWDGHDDFGNDVVSPFHTARLEVTIDGNTATSSGHVIATLLSLPDEGAGFYHHLGTDRANTDDWGRVHVVEALVDIGRGWTHQNRIAYLDLSSHNGGEFRPHHFHRHGECVDIRYIRTDEEGPLDLRWGTSTYDRDASQQLVDALFNHGAVEVFVDQRAAIDGDDIVHVAGHSNHLHASFGLTSGDTGAGRAINQGYVGGPCADDSDCPLRDGFCLLDEGGSIGVCTRECDEACSDYIGGIYTLNECVTFEGQRLCLPALDRERYPDSGCRADLSAQQLPSLDQNNASTDVCVPQ